MALSVGNTAPDFSLPGTGDKQYSLHDYVGKPVVVAFYPGDDTPVCTKQLCSYNNEIDNFSELDAQIIGISSQTVESHERFAKKYGLTFPLLSDTDKKVADAYGTLGPLGFPRRSVFVIDGNGIVRYAHRAIAGLTYRSSQELLAAVKAAV
jgi:thioredoxin-dependent peroxiredoxin